MHLLVNTGGGDAPGLNAVLRAVTLSAVRRGFKVTGIHRGYAGLFEPEGEGLIPLTRDLVRGITDRGGTILGTVNKGFAEDRCAAVVARCNELGADGLIAIGGDGSLRIAAQLMDHGLRVIGVPKTIDNDLSCTDETFGFDSAMSFATEAIGRLTSTAEAHQRVMVVEVMGRYAGWIALYAGIAGAANAILLPEINYDIERVCAAIRHRFETERPFAIVVAAEGACPVGGGFAVKAREAGKEITLGGVAQLVAAQIAERTGYETRSLVLGHLQRGGTPTPADRILALRYGGEAVRLAAAGRWGEMVAWHPPDMRSVPIKDAIAKPKSVPLDSDAIRTARDLG
ncbi:MAG TPA: ATP-dependent 6-phosphofructokinase, partial [Polyangiaceae bacterium]|nr:ATP-dependent 6-phosphofructokinase [Polyangiaceae bacterium]